MGRQASSAIRAATDACFSFITTSPVDRGCMNALVGQEAKANFSLFWRIRDRVRTMAAARMAVISPARALADISREMRVRGSS
jgi:hypothetical protein